MAPRYDIKDPQPICDTCDAREGEEDLCHCNDEG
jgi:hypothetical protein